MPTVNASFRMAAYDRSVSGDRTNEVATHRDKYLRNAVLHRCDGFDGLMTVFTGRLKTKRGPDTLEMALHRCRPSGSPGRSNGHE